MATIESNFESICIDPNDDLVLYKKEIVRSRIEKFLYAICSLDNDDLPTPLSRIEELYNCLVTGEDIPIFTPLSRAEKFVMAMLGAYDVELLPTPISRSETLMKKIATGDNNLDDVDNLQSRYEFLLAYIIKAGGFNGGSPGDSGDFYYKLTSLTSGFTTIHDTFDMPVKNAVLRGSTLVNLVGTYKHTISTVVKPIAWGQKRLFLTNIKPNTRYTLRVKITEVVKGNYGPRVQIFFTTYSTGEINTTTSTSDTLIFTSPAELSSNAHLRLIVTGSEAEATEVDFEILLLEGEHPDIKDIPFVDGMASVKMPVLKTVGKNLFDGKLENGYLSDSTGQPITSDKDKYTPSFIKIDAGKKYCLHAEADSYIGVVSVYYYDDYKNYLGVGRNIINVTDTNISVLFTPHYSGASYVRFRFFKPGGVDLTVNPKNIGFYESSTIIDMYEPHKSNILTCNEEVELRGIGEVKDELNLSTGELTQRIGEIVLDGSEDWVLSAYVNSTSFYTPLNNLVHKVDYLNSMSCDKLVVHTNDSYLLDSTSPNGISAYTDWADTYPNENWIYIKYADSEGYVEKLKQWLSQNPITVQYELAAESVKTVDLSTLDQDGKETELSTFDDITHVTVSSEGLVPTGDIDIARPIQFVDYSIDNGLTTLYNTIDYPVKNAVLKGNTLVNISSLTGVTTLKPGNAIFIENTGMKTNTTYTIMFNCSNAPSTDFVEIRTMMDNTQITQVQQNVSAGYNKFTIKTHTSKETNRFRFKNDTSSTTDFIFSELLILEGDYTNEDIPYFEGMASVKMPVLTTVGKNLYNKTPFIGYIDSSNGKFVKNNTSTRKISDYIEVKPNTMYKVSGCTMTAMWGYDKDKNPVSSINIYTDYITTTNDMRFIAFNINSELEHSNIQIEEGLTATSYEPHKSTTVSCNEEVELRGIGDIKDELNLVTGELTERIGEVVLDGDENWNSYGNHSNQVNTVAFKLSHTNHVSSWGTGFGCCDKLPFTNGDVVYGQDLEGVTTDANNIVVRVNKSKASSIDEFKAWLSNYNIRVVYPNKENVIKTVDLSILNQDENTTLISENGDYIITENGDYINISTQSKKTKLKTFDDITHITVSSEGLIPTGEITVATKNATDVIEASVMSLRMDDILNSQSTLEGSANAQSDDIDVAMLGTTDIYEQLL